MIVQAAPDFTQVLSHSMHGNGPVLQGQALWHVAKRTIAGDQRGVGTGSLRRISKRVAGLFTLRAV